LEKPLPVDSPEEAVGAFLLARFKIIEGAGGRWILIKVDGPDHNVSNRDGDRK